MGVRGTSGLALLLLALQGHMQGHGQVVGSWHSHRDLLGSLEVEWVSPTFPPLSYLSSLLSLEFLWELVGAGERLVPTEALLGVAQNRTVGTTPEIRQAGQGAGTGGRTSGTSTLMRALRSQQEFPQGISQCSGRIRAPSHFSLPPWSQHLQG